MTDWYGYTYAWHYWTRETGKSAATWAAKAVVGRHWDRHITLNGSNVRVALSAVGIKDADLESLTRHLETLLEKLTHRGGSGYSLTLDLSRNWGISDYGIAAYIVPFLRRWPSCRRLKLFQTSIGDRTLYMLSRWAAEGHVQELHMSDLGGLLTANAVLQFLREIHQHGRYPFDCKSGGQAPLWLRLEHNALDHAEMVIAQGRVEGMRLRVLAKTDLSTVRPGATLCHAPTECPEVNLVLFRLQQRKVSVPLPGVTHGQKLLLMLQAAAPTPGVSMTWQEPQPLSVDEFRLLEMEAREDRERGANEWNKETFGEDAAGGWSFEENLAANERIGSWSKALEELEYLPCTDWHCQPDMSVQASCAPDEVASAVVVEALWGVKADPTEGSSSLEAASTASRCSSGTLSKPHQGRSEVDEEIHHVLMLNPQLQAGDFDGRVRQHLHALRNVGGQRMVRRATQLIHEMVAGKTRSCVQKWPAYILTLLKRSL